MGASTTCLFEPVPCVFVVSLLWVHPMSQVTCLLYVQMMIILH